MKHGSTGKPEFLLGQLGVFGISANTVTLLRVDSGEGGDSGHCGGRKFKV